MRADEPSRGEQEPERNFERAKRVLRDRGMHAPFGDKPPLTADERDARSVRLDPDMTLRGLGTLDDLDAATEEKMLRAAWQWLRAGNVVAARRVFEIYGQPWRAASLLGAGVLDDDVQLADDDTDKVAHVAEHVERIRYRWRGFVARRGNPNRWLWKESCWKLSQRNGGVDEDESDIDGGSAGGGSGAMMAAREFERAIYASQCGNVSSRLYARTLQDVGGPVLGTPRWTH